MSSLPDPKGLEGRKEGQTQAPQSRDFFWDSITLYVVAVIVALAAIDVVTEFVRGSQVQCYLPNETDSSLLARVQDYVNEFCTGRLPSLQYLPAIIAVHAIVILAPHYAWLNAYGADLDFFFTHVSKLKRTREVSTGDYDEINYIISEQLENAFSKFSGSNGMYLSYIVKLLFQIFLCIVGIVVVPWLLLNQHMHQVTFECPENGFATKGDAWPLPPYETVHCVFSPLYLLQKIWAVYLFLLAVVGFFLLSNLLLLVKWHTRELGFEKCARFSFVTGMSYHYNHPDPANVTRPMVCCQLPGPCFKPLKSTLEQFLCVFCPWYPYHVQSNYDFLVVKLFRTDGGLGYILKELHIIRHLRMENNSELVKLKLYKSKPSYSDDDFRKFVCGEIGWDIKKLGEHGPVLNSKLLILPKKVPGVVMGCAMRCEGGYRTISNIVEFAARCVRVADDQTALAKDQLPPSEEPKDDDKLEDLTFQQKLFRYAMTNKQTASELKTSADTVVREESSLSESKLQVAIMQKELAQYEQELETAIQRMKNVQELEAAAEASKKRAEIDRDTVSAPTDKRHQEIVNRLQEAIDDTSKVLTETHLSLMEAVKYTAELQVEVQQQRKEIKSKVDEVNDHQKGCNVEHQRTSLQTKLNKLQREQRKLAYMQQDCARKNNDEDKCNQQLPRALKLSGPDLLHALVIGFDMESQGFACALARIFSRVGFINFSSHYTNYQNPLKVLSNTHYLFSAVTPEDILTRDDLLEKRLSLDLKDEQQYTQKLEVSEVVLDDMKEVWRWGYRQAKESDAIKQCKRELGIDTEDFESKVKKLDLKYSTFIVIGPVSSHFHIATVNRVLSKHNIYLSQHAVILTITPIKVGSKEMKKYKEYKPPPPYKPECLNVELTEGESDVLEWPPTGSNGSVSNADFRVKAEDTTMQFHYKLYRKK